MFIIRLFQENDTLLLNLNDSGHKAWVVRIINYLKPSSNKYSHTDLSSTCHGHSATRAGCQLIRHLLRHNDVSKITIVFYSFCSVGITEHILNTLEPVTIGTFADKYLEAIHITYKNYLKF